MINLPAPFNTKAFWETLSTAVAGLLALLAFLGVVDPSWAVPAAVLSTWVFSFLRLFGVEPELRAQALLADLERRLADVKRPTSKLKK